MPIITLLSDWQNNDYYVGIVKAGLLAKNSQIQIIDISHQIKSFHLIEGAFILRSCIDLFPKNTIHLVSIKTVVDKNSPIVVAKYKEQWIISSNNGFIDALGLSYDNVWQAKSNDSSFPELDYFVPIAHQILVNSAQESWETFSNYKKMITASPFVDSEKMILQVHFVDSYGNIMIKIDRKQFELARNNRRFEIMIGSFRHKVSSLHTNYYDVPESEIFALFNKANWMEIGIRNANISQVLNLNTESNIIIKFFE
ncbi:MAG: SAM-dependent chlorinase/fluorinase [Bacteroidales bacterium]|nr:SAM-dependent chlorinase/fluorinase [Bacteroidales bacterium]